MKPCKEKGCSKPRFANQVRCRSHHFEKARERKAKALERKKASKGYQEKQRTTVKNKLDRVVSLIVRSRGACERCGKGASEVQLQNSHIYTRANLAVRWSLKNCKCLCAKCHRWWHQNPTEGVNWLKTVRTEEQLEELKHKANAVKKWTVPELKVLLEDLESQLKVIQEG